MTGGLDRRHYLKAGNIPKSEGGQISPHLCKQSYDLHEIPLTQKEASWSKSIFQEACPCLPPITAIRHVAVPRLSPLPQIL